MKVTKKELANILGVSERIITEWQKEDPPLPRFNNEYETKDIISWYTRRAVNKAVAETPKDRLDRIKGDREELQLMKDLELLAPLDIISAAWITRVTACRQDLLGLPLTLATEIKARYGVDIDENILLSKIENCLIKLSASMDAIENLEDSENSNDEDTNTQQLELERNAVK